MGAAIQGAAIAGAEVSAVLVDVTPYTFGTSALGELDGELYPYQLRADHRPATRRSRCAGARRSTPWWMTRPRWTCSIFQGENEDALENIQIGEFRIDGPEQGAGGQPGDARSGARPRRNPAGRGAREEHRPGAADQHRPGGGALRSERNSSEARQRIGALFGQPEEAEPRSDVATGPDDALAGQGQAKLDEAGEEDRTEMIDLIETIRDARATATPPPWRRARSQLEDLLFYLET